MLTPDEDRVGQRRTKAGDHKAEAVNSRDGRKLHPGEVARRRIARQIPREADDRNMGAGEFQRHP